MIFQNPRMALNPIRKVGDQIEDVLKRHAQATSAEAGEKAIEALEQVRIARPRERYTPIHSSSPAACASAWSLHWRWPAIRSS
jgi:ABC-type dipeptide/oligopeptide/nickel transport system ATPase component